MAGSGLRVMGVAQKAIATQVSTNPYLVWDVPEGWSLADAASVPVAYATAYYSLVVRGRLRRGFSVLIHSGSGAVGLAAIQICLNRGCQVRRPCQLFLTEGPRKGIDGRNLLFKSCPHSKYL